MSSQFFSSSMREFFKTIYSILKEFVLFFLQFLQLVLLQKNTSTAPLQAQELLECSVLELV